MDKKEANEAVEKVLLYKGTLIKKDNEKYRTHIEKILAKRHNVDDPIEAFIMGAVDAMIYDIACSLGFTNQYQTSYEMRKKSITKLWKKESLEK